MPLTEKERQQINTIVARFEADTGIQAVAAVTSKADAYPEIPWKAYAMGSCFGAALAALNPLVISGWSHSSFIAFDAMLILSCGATLSLLAAFVPAIGRLFLDRVRAQAESEQYAQSMFLDRELFRTRSRRAVLIVLCRFERLATVVTDVGLRQYVARSTLQALGADARSRLASGRGEDLVAAFETIFDRVKTLLTEGGCELTQLETNEIDDEVVTERGP